MNKVTYKVRCEESQTWLYLDSPNQQKCYCDECDEDHDITNLKVISIKEEPEHEETKPEALLLQEVSTKKEFKISDQGIFGRSGDYNSHLMNDEKMWETISNEHLKFSHEGNDWFVEHIGRNPTVVNGKILTKGERTLVPESNGRINIAAVIFKFKREGCEINAN